ncbi:Hypothetical protein POVR1_LOCUS177, partial [uncultured virus]
MKRLIEHYKGSGSAYTTKYKVIDAERIIENASPYDEDRYVKEYMYMYGIDNVRGGTYVTDELSKAQKQFIITEIYAAQDLCTRCGSASHYAKICDVSRSHVRMIQKNGSFGSSDSLDPFQALEPIISETRLPKPINDTYVKPSKNVEPSMTFPTVDHDNIGWHPQDNNTPKKFTKQMTKSSTHQPITKSTHQPTAKQSTHQPIAKQSTH